MSYTDRGVYIELPKEPDDPRIIDEVRIVILFDGTHNNMDNIDAFRRGEKGPSGKIYDSYTKEYSNIARLFTVKIDESNELRFIYVGGVETADYVKGSPGKDTSGASGAWKYGINAKISYGCKHIQAKVNEIFNNTEATMIKKLKIDVFGFSRGAATARSFVSRLEDVREGSETENFEVCLRKNFLPNKEGKNAVEKIIPSFVGLFDTVSSYDKLLGIFGGFNNDVQELELQLPATVEKVVQLSAADEYRKYFSLTNIDSAVNNGNGEELILPGSHADIGGSHYIEEREVVVMQPEINAINSDTFYYRSAKYCGYKAKEELISEGWTPFFDDRSYPYRTIFYHYSFIPLHLMAKYANDNFTIYKDNNIIEEYGIPDDLKTVNERIKQIKGEKMYDFKGNKAGFNFIGTEADQEMLRALRGKYLHLSATGGLAHQPADKNQRKIIEG